MRRDRAAATAGVRPARREHDRPLRRAPAALAPRAPSTTSSLGGLDRGDHQRERLVLPVLARAQRRDGTLVVGAARQVKAADPLDRHDPPGEERPGRRLDGVARRRRAGSPSRRGRPASATARTPGTRSAVRGSGDRPDRRTRPGSVGHIRNAAIVVSGRSYGTPCDDCEPRAAVGAVGERVAVTAVGGIEQLAQAVLTGRGVGA